MEVTAKARFIRIAPRKVRLVADLVRGLTAAEADAQLSFYRKEAARPLLKLLRSAVANAEHNFHLDRGGLRIKTLTVDGGPVLKRFRPRAFGRAATIRKRTSHIVMVLTDGKAAKPAAAPAEGKAPAAKAAPAPVRQVKGKKGAKP